MQNALHVDIIKENFESRRIRILDGTHLFKILCSHGYLRCKNNN